MLYFLGFFWGIAKIKVLDVLWFSLSELIKYFLQMDNSAGACIGESVTGEEEGVFTG